MKLIHCADLHLDSRMESGLPPEKARERRMELLHTFTKMVDMVAEDGVKQFYCVEIYLTQARCPCGHGTVC